MTVTLKTRTIITFITFITFIILIISVKVKIDVNAKKLIYYNYN